MSYALGTSSRRCQMRPLPYRCELALSNGQTELDRLAFMHLSAPCGNVTTAGGAAVAAVHAGTLSVAHCCRAPTAGPPVAPAQRHGHLHHQSAVLHAGVCLHVYFFVCLMWAKALAQHAASSVVSSAEHACAAGYLCNCKGGNGHAAAAHVK